jgi:uncharacterized protein YbaR (Trm112 family)
MEFTAAHLGLLVCPVCHASLTMQADGIECVGCGRVYPVVDGLPVLLAERAVLSRNGTTER